MYFSVSELFCRIRIQIIVSNRSSKNSDPEPAKGLKFRNSNNIGTKKNHKIQKQTVFRPNVLKTSSQDNSF